MERLRPQIERQVEHGLRSLSEEFEAEVAPDAIWRAGRQRLRAIRVPARFDDFVPVLVYRSVREGIIERLRHPESPTVAG